MAKKKPTGTTPAPTSATTPATTAAPVAKSGSATSARQALVTTGILLGFVFLMTMVAGLGPNAGKLSAALMIALIVLQALGHVNPFVTWAANHPLTPGGSTFTVSTQN